MIVTRLKEGEDLKKSICDFVAKKNLKSACIVSAVGSLSHANIRMAGASHDSQDMRSYSGSFEIVSLIGTISSDGKAHLHISISDSDGNVIGGHLKDGCIVHTTVELALISDDKLIFTRVIDINTGFDELVIKELS